MISNTIDIKSWCGMDFVRIPLGEFIMGSTDENEWAWGDERPQHIVEIPYDYWLARFPVSNAQFEEFVCATSYETQANQEGWGWVWNVKEAQWERRKGANWKHPLGGDSTIASLMDHPAVQVCWYDALAFCEWLNQKAINDLPHDFRFRLPSEAEWEKAARGVDGREWPWGNRFDSALCNSKAGCKEGTIPVGSHSPQGDSVYGTADMSGNVWEWTLTVWGEDRDTPAFVYPYISQDGREDQDAGDGFFRIIRGGSFKDDLQGVRCACRDLDPPRYSLSNLGFRVCLAPLLEK